MSLLQSNRKNIQDKVVVITGASSGVGLTKAISFAKEGCRLVLAARGVEGLVRATEKCKEFGAKAIYKKTDMSIADDVKELVDFTLKHLGEIDFWVNNVGVMTSGKFEEICMNINEQVIKTNLMGYMHGAYYVLPVFKK